MISRRMLLVSTAVLTLASTAHAEEADVIVKRAFGKDAISLASGHATVTLTVTEEDGKTTESKTFEIWSKKKDGLLRTVVRFKSPAKIAGTAFLILQRSGQPDEHWIYLPAYKKARRITTKERGTAFAGSDFTYADFERHDLEEASYKKLPEESIAKEPCNVIDATPKAKDAVYDKITSWLRKTDDVPMRTHFYVGGKLDKTLSALKVKTVEGKPVIVEARIERPGSKRSTVMRVDDVTFKSEVPDSFFTVTALDGG